MKKQTTYNFYLHVFLFLLINAIYLITHDVLHSFYYMFYSPKTRGVELSFVILTYQIIIIPAIFVYLFFNKVINLLVVFLVFSFYLFEHFQFHPLRTLLILFCFSFALLSSHILLYIFKKRWF